ncbi:MAG TPA: hypothetical protein VFU15_09945 [Bacteroidia bacterium]|nr:hypothetical protein [Bacteroidia bacterium]
MKKIILLPAIVFFFSCHSSPEKVSPDPVGTWKPHVMWDNNDITLQVLPDSMIKFKAVKGFCPGIKTFVSVGKWTIVHDSILQMTQYTDGRRYTMKQLFPELVLPNDSVMPDVIPLDMNARFIIAKDHLYDVELDGKRSVKRYYDRKK